MRTILTIQELLKGRNAGFDSAAKQEKKIQMTCLPLNTIQGNNGIDFFPYQVSTAQELLEKYGRVAFKVFVSYWGVDSNRKEKRAERMIDADYIVFFIACEKKVASEKCPARLVAVYEVKNHNIKTDAKGNYLIDLVEMADFKDFYNNNVYVEYVSDQEMTHDFATNPKTVI